MERRHERGGNIGSSLNGARMPARRVRSEPITSFRSSYFREPILHLHTNRRCAKRWLGTAIGNDHKCMHARFHADEWPNVAPKLPFIQWPRLSLSPLLFRRSYFGRSIDIDRNTIAYSQRRNNNIRIYYKNVFFVKLIKISLVQHWSWVTCILNQYIR